MKKKAKSQVKPRKRVKRDTSLKKHREPTKEQSRLVIREKVQLEHIRVPYPDFVNVRTERPVWVDKEVINAIVKDKEVINAIIQDEIVKRAVIHEEDVTKKVTDKITALLEKKVKELLKKLEDVISKKKIVVEVPDYKKKEFILPDYKKIKFDKFIPVTRRIVLTEYICPNCKKEIDK